MYLLGVLLCSLWALCYGSPNVLVLLADDLGYGDLSLPPFTGGGIATPSLEMMAKSSVVLTNFHVAAPVCTPSRAAMLTGVFPHRLGIDWIFGSGPQAADHLSVVPNAANIFRAAGYHTAHVGKWHLGGMRPEDIRARERFASANDSKKCAPPGINQHGFEEYIAMQEGQGSMRLGTLIKKNRLYKDGAQYLYRNDKPYKKSYDDLTKRQGDEVINIIETCVEKKEKFYMHFWFDAPHKPLEAIEPHAQGILDLAERANSHGLPNRALTNQEKYTPRVMQMDAQIGRVLDTLDRLGIAEDTIVVFTSDNGPENGGGNPGKFRGRKRSVHEGGIRVPSLWQWKGHWDARYDDSLVMSTDMLPTFLAATGVAQPAGIHFDGKNIGPFLEGRERTASTGRRPAWYTRLAAMYDEATNTKIVLQLQNKAKKNGTAKAIHPAPNAHNAAAAFKIVSGNRRLGTESVPPGAPHTAKRAAAKPKTVAAVATKTPKKSHVDPYSLHMQTFDLGTDKYESNEKPQSDFSLELRKELAIFMNEGCRAHELFRKTVRNAPQTWNSETKQCAPPNVKPDEMKNIDWSLTQSSHTILTPAYAAA